MAFRRILVVDDEEPMRHILTHILTAAGYDVRAVPDGAAALREVELSEPDLILTDIRMPGLSGLELLTAAKERAPQVMVIVMSAYGSFDSAVAAMKAGAYDYISKPFRPDEVVLVLRKAEEREHLVRENRRLRDAQPGPRLKAGGDEPSVEGIVGESEALKTAVGLARKVARVKTTALLLGESGTGKELFARLLHELSPRQAGPFLAVNCGAIPEHLIESELFGHVKGAFTDASRARKGLFEEADGGTLLLDEIGELPLSMQVKLLRVLQEEEVRRIGDSRSVKVDVRVVAATVRDLPAMVGKGTFREDLYHRLNVFQLRLPPLRERSGDVKILVRHFLRYFNRRLGLQVEGFTPEALALLDGYAWPGNVRELENVVERALVLADGSVIDVEGLPERLLLPSPAERAAAASIPVLADGDLSLKRASRALEGDFIRKALVKTKGNRTRAAELLDLSHRALLYKLKEYGIT
jgi:two-component system response regulator AtoC